ncbi:hypothetical protein [Serratia marcescens]|uniref:hypothetical protein n=1 Tax=Serratia marcescens TaxID=615 RepID=UPI004036915D
MALLTINRKQLEQAATLDTDRQLIQYISNTLAPVLPRIPAQPELIGPFVHKAGREAIDRGFSEGGYYSFHIIADLLLGRSWERSPFYIEKFEKYLDAPGVEQSARITLAMQAVIDARHALEAVLPKVIDIAVKSLSIHPELFKPEDIWNAFQHMAWACGVSSDKVLPLFEDFEAGFRRANGLPPIQREKLPGNIEVAYTAQGIPLPKPSDVIHDLTLLQMMQFNGSLLLALIHGPAFANNLFLAELLQTLNSTNQAGVFQHELKEFLLAHRRALTENADE